MIEISIGGLPRNLKYADESWINQEINGRRENGETVCVRVTIRTADVDLTFSSPGCPSRGGRLTRDLTRAEKQVHELWKNRGLNADNFTGGSVIAFLKQLDRIV